jgi:nitrite reductase (NADH) large subunit
MAVGIRPSTALAKSAGLEVERGIMVDDHMVTSDPAIMSVGECVQHRGICYGLVAPLWEMCRSLADAAVATPNGYTGSVTSTKLKVSGIDLFSAGDFSGGEGCEDIVMRDAARGVYKRVIVKDNKLVGAVLYGDTADGSWYFDLLKREEDVSDIREALIFGQAFAQGGGALADPNAAVAALSDDAEICGCNGVTKARWLTPSMAGPARSTRCAASARLRLPAVRAPVWWKACLS